MKNLANESPEVVEELPSRDVVRLPDGHRHYWGSDYPYNKVHRFLMSRVGTDWNEVFSEFVHLEWVPEAHKTRERIAQTVILNTFEKDGKVWFYDNWSYNGNEKSIEDYRNGYGQVFYVHPKTKALCFHRPKQVNEKKRREEEQAKTMRILGDYHQLLKLKGTWFEVKAKKAESDIIEIDGLHWKKIVHFIPPETKTMKFFGRNYKAWKVNRDDPPTWIVVNGEYYVPSHGEWRHSGRDIGPKDRLIDDEEGVYYWNRHNYSSIKITLQRQLNSKELKKYGIRNDIKIEHRCPICGGKECLQKHDRRCDICGARWCQNHEHHNRPKTV
jgi:hypothetical protein